MTPTLEHNIYEVKNGWEYEISLMEYWKYGQNKVLYAREGLTKKEAELLMNVGYVYVDMVNDLLKK